MYMTIWVSVVLLSIIPTISNAIPVGVDFQVSTYTGAQRDPAVASDGAGNVVVVWGSIFQDGSFEGIFGRRYDGTGALQGAEFQVNTYTYGNQILPSVSSDAVGNFVVVWTGFQSTVELFGQRFSSTGAPTGAEFQVNAFTTGTQFGARVSSDGVGNFVVVWEGIPGDGDANGVVGRRFDGAGVALGPDFQVNTYTTNNQGLQAVAHDGGGNFVVVWNSEGQDGDGPGVFGQRYDSAGTPQGTEFAVNTYTTHYQRSPDVAADGAGNFVVVWQSYGQNGPSYEIFARRYNSAGVAQGPEVQVNTYTTSNQHRPRVAANAAGDFVVVWQGYQGGSIDDVFGQRYDGTGMVRGGEFQVNTYTRSDQATPDVAVDAAGNFAVVWDSGLPVDHIYARRHSVTPPFGATKLVIKDNPDPSKRKIIFRSKDPKITTRPGLGIDPVADGATFHVYNNNGSGDSACFTLPSVSDSWQAKGMPLDPQFVYRDSQSVNGPCRSVRAKPGRLKVVCRAKLQPIPYSLDEPAQVSVGVTFKSGETTYCAVFGGTVAKDEPNRVFSARNAPAPAACPTPPAPCP